MSLFNFLKRKKKCKYCKRELKDKRKSICLACAIANLQKNM